jgi:Zn ribbon nucleic-acid-binding protein
LIDTAGSIQIKYGGSFKSYGDLITQALDAILSETLSTRGTLMAYNQYIFAAICPKCNQETIIHMRSNKRGLELVKRVTCGHCGKDFVVVKRK